MPTTSGRVAAYSTSALPNGAAFTRCPSEAIEAIIAEVVSRGFFSVDGGVHAGAPSGCM